MTSKISDLVGGLSMSQYLTFDIQGRSYAVEAAYVNSIVDTQVSTPLPATGTLVTGLTNVRGNVVPVFDPRPLLDRIGFDLDDSGHRGGERTASPSRPLPEDRGLVIFEVPNGTMLPFIGMEVDRIGKVVLLEPRQILPVPAYLSEGVARYYQGFCLDQPGSFAVLRLPDLVARQTLFPAIGGDHG